MSKSALSDAFNAGWAAARSGNNTAISRVRAFEQWWQHAVDTTDRSPMIIGIDHAAPDSEITVTYIVDADGRVVG